jgi:hypothetical protein
LKSVEADVNAETTVSSHPSVRKPRLAARPRYGRNLLNAARYYFGNRWAQAALGGVAVGIGVYFGGWGWLVAGGAAPIILSILPCLVMCGLGVCMMRRSNKSQSAASHAASGAATSSAPPTLPLPRWTTQVLVPAAAKAVALEGTAAETGSITLLRKGDTLMRKTTTALLFASILFVGPMTDPPFTPKATTTHPVQ